MKYALMSDVHANPAALKTALADAAEAGCGKLIMLGDTTGYGYDAKAALDLVRQNFDAVLMGNHDSVCVGLDYGGLVDINPNYDLDRSVGARLSQEDVAWLKKRKYLFEGDGFVAVHGDFTAPGNWNYITESEEARRNFMSREETLMFCGHTHRMAVWEMTSGGAVCSRYESEFGMMPGVAEGVEFKVKDGSRYIVNVGSVGYPRNDFCSSYAIYDTEEKRVTVRRIPFDFKSYIDEILQRKLDLPSWLYQLLLFAKGK